MKHINLTIEDKDFNLLEKAKIKTGLSWEKFFIYLIKKLEKKIK